MRSFLTGERLPQIPSRMVISAGFITIILAPMLIVNTEQTWQIRLITLFMILIFAGVELLEQRLYEKNEEPRTIAILFLISRIIIAGLVVKLDNSPPTSLLTALIPFNAYFVFGAYTSNLIGFGYLIISFTRITGFGFLISDGHDALMSWVIQNVVMIFLLIFARALHRDKEQQHYTEQLLADIQASHRELQAYAIQVAELAAVEERNRLARDIHDSVGHYLTGVNIQLERARVFHARDPEQSLQAIQEAKQAAQEALNDVRRSVSGLREPSPAFTLRHSLETLVNGLAIEQPGIDFSFVGDETDYNQLVLLTLYRAAQEGLTNIRKHANATRIKLKIMLNEQEARLSLQDNGLGISQEILSRIFMTGTSYGLRGIRERVELVQGKIILNSQDHQGTTLEITIPKNPLKTMAGIA